MAGNGDKEDLSLIRISGEELALFEILEEVALTRLLPCDIARRLIVHFEVPIRVYIHLHVPLHYIVTRTESCQIVID